MSWEKGPFKWICALKKGSQYCSFMSFTMWDHPWTRKLTPTRYPTCWCPDIWASHTPEQWEVNFYYSWVTQCLVFCSGNLGRLCHRQFSWLWRAWYPFSLCHVHGVSVLSSGQALVTFLVAATENGLRKQGLFWLTVWGYRPFQQGGREAEAWGRSCCIGHQEVKDWKGRCSTPFLFMIYSRSHDMGWSHLHLGCVKSALLN